MACATGLITWRRLKKRRCSSRVPRRFGLLAMMRCIAIETASVRSSDGKSKPPKEVSLTDPHGDMGCQAGQDPFSAYDARLSDR